MIRIKLHTHRLISFLDVPALFPDLSKRRKAFRRSMALRRPIRSRNAAKGRPLRIEALCDTNRFQFGRQAGRIDLDWPSQSGDITGRLPAVKWGAGHGPMGALPFGPRPAPHQRELPCLALPY